LLELNFCWQQHIIYGCLLYNDFVWTTFYNDVSMRKIRRKSGLNFFIS